VIQDLKIPPLWLLTAAIAIGGVVSHMPSRYRYYYRKNRHCREKRSEGLGSPLAVRRESDTFLQLGDADHAHGKALGATASDGLGIRTLPAEMSNDPAGVEEIDEGAGIHSCTGARW